ncbi:molybdate ABC transporter substrate-binding protein [Bryobacterales bacterium F-183]|nr:molybdate ABC transporter substrate-binding protein [Bryobacterales bacterium F-183]
MIVLALCLLTAQQELQIAAASDLSAVSKALAAGFEKEVPGVRVRFTNAASGILAKQIENGAPFDVFLSANEKFVMDLSKSGRLEGFSVRQYAVGQLGMWSAKGQYQTLEDLLRPEVKHVAIANPKLAPYGAAAREALDKVWQRIATKIVYGENVRQALQYAETGNADVVLTSWALLYAKSPPAVRLPANLHQPIRQSGGIVKGSKQAKLAERFLVFLTKGKGAEILRSSGFETP